MMAERVPIILLRAATQRPLVVSCFHLTLVDDDYTNMPFLDLNGRHLEQYQTSDERIVFLLVLAVPPTDYPQWQQTLEDNNFKCLWLTHPRYGNPPQELASSYEYLFGERGPFTADEEESWSRGICEKPPTKLLKAERKSIPNVKALAAAKVTTGEIMIPECVICANNLCNTVCKPCYHSVLCSVCFPLWWTTENCKRTCPVCNTPIKDIFPFSFP
jgi:hypothetical protein